MTMTTMLPSWICKVIADSARRDVVSRIFRSRPGTYSIGQSNFGVLNSYNIVHDDDLLPWISNIKPTTLTEITTTTTTQYPHYYRLDNLLFYTFGNGFRSETRFQVLLGRKLTLPSNDPPRLPRPQTPSFPETNYNVPRLYGHWNGA